MRQKIKKGTLGTVRTVPSVLLKLPDFVLPGSFQ